MSDERVWKQRLPEEIAWKQRIDQFFCDACGAVPRSRLKQQDARFFLDGRSVKASAKVEAGSLVEVHYRPLYDEAAPLRAQDIDLDIIYEDQRLLVVHKPQGIVVHPGAGNPDRTLVNALLYHYPEFVSRFGVEDQRPGIVHRLDKDTSGLLLVAKDPETKEKLIQLFSRRNVEKQYIAIVKGSFASSSGLLSSWLCRDPKNRKRFTWSRESEQGKWAETEYRRIKMGERISLVSFHLITGRTHQIRVHALMSGHPILGDEIYARRDRSFPDSSLMLHAMRLGFAHPWNGKQLSFTAPLPERFFEPIRAEFGIDPASLNLD